MMRARCRTCRSSSTRRTRPAAATWSCRWPGPAIAAGADGVMVDVHPQPETALCDGAQALIGASLDELAEAVATIPALLGRTSAAHHRLSVTAAARRRQRRQRHERAQHLDRVVDAVVVDVQVRRPAAAACGPTALSSTPCSRALAAAAAGRRRPRPSTMFVSQRRRIAAELGRQPLRPGVIVGQPVDVVRERVAAGRGQDADLAHAAAVALAPDAGLGDAVGASTTSTEPTGAPSPFDRQTDTVSKPAASSRSGGAGRDVRVPDAGAVQVQRQPVLARASSTTAATCAGSWTVPPPKLWVFSSAIAVVETKYGPGVRGDQLREPLDVDQAALARPGAEGDAGERRRRAEFGPGDVRHPVADDLFARAARAAAGRAGCPSSRSARTAPASKPNSSATSASSALTRRVVAVDVVADLGLGHRLAHRRRRPGDGVAAQIDRSLGRSARAGADRPPAARPPGTPARATARCSAADRRPSRSAGPGRRRSGRRCRRGTR